MSELTEIQKVAVKANRFYWETHSLLHACSLIAGELDDDYIELKELLSMASMKACEMQDCFNAHIPSKEIRNV